MKNDRCYIDIHVLQTVPPSCVNRDDTGSPKTAFYGGVTRARVSSQAWKRAMRVAFREIFEQEKLGLRTKKVLARITDAMLLQEPTLDVDSAEKKAIAALDTTGFSLNKAKETDALFFVSYAQAKALAQLTLRGADKMEIKSAMKDNPSVDQILFGRMVASDPSLNYDAAAQVAHSISTHAVQNEFDYFTAVDDCASMDNAGAGHIGTTEFNSATLYRYSTVNVDELVPWLAGDTAAVVKGFLEAFCYSMPTGKQNSFANRTVPDFVYVAVRGDQPVNMAGAFEKPVHAGSDGYLKASEEALASYAKQTYEMFVSPPRLSLGTGRSDVLSGFAEQMPLPALIERIGEFVESRMAEGGDAE